MWLKVTLIPCAVVRAISMTSFAAFTMSDSMDIDNVELMRRLRSLRMQHQLIVIWRKVERFLRKMFGEIHDQVAYGDYARRHALAVHERDIAIIALSHHAHRVEHGILHPQMRRVGRHYPL